MIKSISEKCNILIQQQQLNSIAHARYFIISVKINNCRLIAIVDSDTTDNFIIRTLVKRKDYSTQKKSDIYNLVIVDRNLLFDKNKKVNKRTKLLSIAIQQYYKKLIFDIVEIVIYNIVLKIS